MSRLLRISTFALSAMMTLNAGQISIGGTNGLTNSYMNTAGNTDRCSGFSNAASTAASGFNSCLAVTQASGTLQRNFMPTLFQNATGVTGTATTASSAGSPTGGTVVGTFNDASNGGVTFQRVKGDLITGGSIQADFWAPNAALSTAIVVPVGIYGVDKAWTMLQDYWGGNGQVGNFSVAFSWDDSSNGLGGGLGGATSGDDAAYTQTFNFTNGTQIRSAVQCAGVVPSTTGVCPSVTTNGAMPISTSIDTMVNHTLTAVEGGTAVVRANNIFQSAYTAIGTTGLGNRYNNTTGGFVRLDDQMFDFGSAHINEFLVSMTIRAQFTSGYTGATSIGGNYRTALSAITVNQVDAVNLAEVLTPEPGTIFLAFAGLGAVAYFRRRKA